jgi:hypothetical protein
LHLAAMLDMLDDFAIGAQLPGVRRVLSEQRRAIFEVVSWLGTPFANTNSNSYSKEQGSTRITNSNSRQGESEIISPVDSTNTKHEEQAP